MRLEDGGGAGTWVAYAAIVAFVLALALVVLRTVILYSILLLLPIGRVVRRIPGLGRFVDRLGLDRAR